MNRIDKHDVFQVWDQVGNQVWKQVRVQVMNRVWKQVRVQVRDEIRDRLWDYYETD